MEIKLEIDDRDVRLGLERLRWGTQNPEPAMKDIGEYYIERIDRRFEEEGPRWKALTPRYARWKARQPRAIDKILQFSGLLRASINYEVEGPTVSIGSDKIYAARQEKERPFLKPEPADEQEFTDILKRYLVNQFGG